MHYQRCTTAWGTVAYLPKMEVAILPFREEMLPNVGLAQPAQPVSGRMSRLNVFILPSRSYLWTERAEKREREAICLHDPLFALCDVSVPMLYQTRLPHPSVPPHAHRPQTCFPQRNRIFRSELK